jgi:hypothetical protein
LAEFELVDLADLTELSNQEDCYIAPE